jgi:phenol 2-monooxygenase (NADPH)
VDTLDPYLLNAHQGFVEDVLLKDMMERGYDVTRDITFVDFQPTADTSLIDIICESNETHEKSTFTAKFLVGCDGAHSNVRRSMGARQIGSRIGEIWGVLDGVLDTNFPDLYSKTIIHSKDAGTLLLLPRERNMTRIYVEIKSEVGEFPSKVDLTEQYVMDRATEIMEPYVINWKSLGRYLSGFGRISMC